MKSFFREGMILVIFVNGGEPFVCSKIQKSPALSIRDAIHVTG
jgi:hypothetical protein